MPGKQKVKLVRVPPRLGMGGVLFPISLNRIFRYAINQTEAIREQHETGKEGVMRNKKFIFSIALFLSIFLILVSCSKQKAAWKGTIEEIDGVTVVKNPKDPMYGEEVFILEEELSIGDVEGPEEYMFSRIRSLAVDNGERIYVLDAKEAHVKVFDQLGKYIRTIGRKGQGPGELQSPLNLYIKGQNELVVEDMTRQLAFFSLEGQFKKNLLTAKAGALGIDIDSEGNIVATVIVREEENPRYELQKFDSELNYLHSLGSSPLRSASTSGYNPFSPIIQSEINCNDQVVTGYPEKYEIKIYDKSGTMVRKIMKEYDPVEITEEEIKEAKEGMPWERKLSIPKYHNAYRWIITDDEGRMLVRTFEREADGGDYYHDIFDEKGRYIARIPLGFFPRVWKKNKFYTVEEDEEGYQQVKRYRVTWRY